VILIRRLRLVCWLILIRQSILTRQSSRRRGPPGSVALRRDGPSLWRGLGLGAAAPNPSGRAAVQHRGKPPDEPQEDDGQT
jgi:hypothetical protein